jgi:hypothetical protein
MKPKKSLPAKPQTPMAMGEPVVYDRNKPVSAKRIEQLKRQAETLDGKGSMLQFKLPKPKKQ